jgi:hypothetical protein
LGAFYCRKTASKGGTCIFVLNHLNFVKINIETHCAEFWHWTVYQAPSGNFSFFLNKMDKILRLLYNSNVEFIICGDFNVNYLTDNSRKSKLNSLLNSYNLFSIIDFPTRIQNSSKSAIDNIFIDYWRLGPYPLLNSISDHDAQLIDSWYHITYSS